MTRRTYALIAGLVAAGVGTWWWRSHASGSPSEFEGKGTVIFDNTPQPGSDMTI